MGLFSKNVTPQKFYTLCLEKTHALAAEKGYVKCGVKLIPELMPYCDRLIESDINCPEILEQYSDNVSLVRIMDFRCMMYGIILANTWHLNFSRLPSMATTLEIDGPNNYIQLLVEGILSFTPTQFSQWLQEAYEACMLVYGEHAGDGTEYLFNTMRACYQLGISMMLSYYGL